LRHPDPATAVATNCATYNAAFKKNIGGVTDEVLAVLLNHFWPGNIRELKHVIEHAFVLCRDSVIAAEHLPAYLAQAAQQQDISATLDKTGGNKAGAARLLGVSRQTVYRKIKKDKAARNEQS
jgi:transcriptional regulator of acetoin/glycerol metabolism